MSQSSIEWLMEKIATKDSDSFISMSFYIAFKEEFQQAKEMHKQEIIEAWDNAAIDATYGNKFSSAEQYYNETFKK